MCGRHVFSDAQQLCRHNWYGIDLISLMVAVVAVGGWLAGGADADLVGSPAKPTVMRLPEPHIPRLISCAARRLGAIIGFGPHCLQMLEIMRMPS